MHTITIYHQKPSMCFPPLNITTQPVSVEQDPASLTHHRCWHMVPYHEIWLQPHSIFSKLLCLSAFAVHLSFSPSSKAIAFYTRQAFLSPPQCLVSFLSIGFAGSVHILRKMQKPQIGTQNSYLFTNAQILNSVLAFFRGIKKVIETDENIRCVHARPLKEANTHTF